MLPSDSKEFRVMPEMAWKFIREILQHHSALSEFRESENLKMYSAPIAE